jgi:hypothetical protein
MTKTCKMTKALREKMLSVQKSLKAKDEMSVCCNVRQVRPGRQVS